MKLTVSVLALATAAIFAAHADDTPLAPLKIKLPAPAFIGTPSDLPVGSTVEKPTGQPRPLLMVPADVTNVALGRPVTCSSSNVVASDLTKLTDGDKESRESSVVLLRKGVQWVQVDLGSEQEIFAIAVWHNHDAPKVYHGVVVEVADDPDFKQNAQVVFNNDQANLDGLGVGSNREYFETNEGKLIDTKGIKGRYVRLYSDGSTESKLNEYLEIEVYGRPAK
jgi:hypothetical protein